MWELLLIVAFYLIAGNFQSQLQAGKMIAHRKLNMKQEAAMSYSKNVIFVLAVPLDGFIIIHFASLYFFCLINCINLTAAASLTRKLPSHAIKMIFQIAQMLLKCKQTINNKKMFPACLKHIETWNIPRFTWNRNKIHFSFFLYFKLRTARASWFISADLFFPDRLKCNNFSISRILLVFELLLVFSHLQL